ncbi:MAG TPA: hypothetical protein VIC05_13130 [Solirubrobacteraceae bacterium]|jgi:uncharacterized membrane protein
MMYWNGHMSTGGWIISVLWTVIVLALVAAAIVWLISALSRGNPVDRSAVDRSEASAREIIDRRLAQGEITIAEYGRLRDALSGKAAQVPVESGSAQPASPSG